MQIHAFGLSRVPAFLGQWDLDFDGRSGVFPISLTGEKNVALFLDALKFALFDVPSEKLGENPEVRLGFSTEEGQFEILRSPENTEIRKNGMPFDLQAAPFPVAMARITHLDADKLEDTLFYDILSTSESLTENADTLASSLIGNVSESLGNAILTQGIEVSQQKAALLAASQSVIDGISVVSDEEEERLNQQLIKAGVSHAALQNEIAQLKDSMDWLIRINMLKDEAARLSKQLTAVNGDLSRFDVKKNVLEKALRADALAPDYDALSKLRVYEKEEGKLIAELKKSVPMLSERVRSASLAYAEADKNFKSVLENYNEKCVTLERVRELDEKIEASQIQSKHLKEELFNEQTAARLLSEESTRLKNVLSQLTIRSQLLNKKMDDLSMDKLLVEELEEYKRLLDEIDAEVIRSAEAEETQRELQKRIESSRSALLDVQNVIAALKNEELAVTGELSMKERMLFKSLGTEGAETLAAELDNQNERLNALDALQGRIVLLAEGHDRFNQVKAELESTKHALRLATVALNAARQAYIDKTAVVNSAQQAYSFYLEVLSLNEQRDKLANGKPCPLCGAIHHPYSVKLPFDRSLEDKLAKAKEDAQLALIESEKCEAEFSQLQLQQTEAENILNTLTSELNEAKGEILYIASELNIVGLREKKPITWAAVLKQKQTSLANRRDDLEARLEKIQGLTEAIESLKEKREDAALKTARKKEEQASLEEALKNFANMSAELEKNQKDSELNRVSLTRLLERAFARFGLKASNPAIMKQNLPTLEKRREQWINWSAEKKQIEEETAQSEEALRNTISSLTAQKKSAETLEKDIETLTEQIKRFQKERHEAIASQTPEEVIAAIETEKANATRLAEEAKLSLAAKEEALLSTQNKINSLEAHRSETIKSIESLSDAFNQKLQKAGFPNESSFLSSQISTAQKDDLMRQNDELLERYRVVNSQYEEKQQALNSLQEKNLTTRTREQLEEELLEKSDLFHTATAQLTSLREKMAKNANNKNRRKREEAEFQKLQTSLERWESLCANVEKPGGIARLGLSLAVAYGSADIDAFISGAKIKLRDEGVKLFAPELSDASGLADMKTISADQRFFVALSLLLGRSELFARRSKPEFVILKQNQNEAFPSQTFTGLESLNLTIGVAR